MIPTSAGSSVTGMTDIILQRLSLLPFLQGLGRAGELWQVEKRKADLATDHDQEAVEPCIGIMRCGRQGALRLSWPNSLIRSRPSLKPYV